MRSKERLTLMTSAPHTLRRLLQHKIRCARHLAGSGNLVRGFGHLLLQEYCRCRIVIIRPEQFDRLVLLCWCSWTLLASLVMAIVADFLASEWGTADMTVPMYTPPRGSLDPVSS
jgi:hypothetical protein